MPQVLQFRHVYEAPQVCIFCGDDEGPFGEEHIIPRNMGGALVFKDATCKRCERIINSEIETPVANMTGSLRRRTIPVRNRDRKRRPSISNLQIFHQDGRTVSHTIPSADMPRTLYLPAFSTAMLLTPRATYYHLPEMWTVAHKGDLKRAEQKFGGVGHIAGRYDLTTFARQLAKIAHAYVAAEYPPMKHYEQLLPKFILNGEGNYREFVGGSLLRPQSEGCLYRIIWARQNILGFEYLVCVLRLFAFARSPVYEVAVARKRVD